MPTSKDDDLSRLLAETLRRDPRASGMVKRSLQVMRRHLGLQVAYVSEFVDDLSVFREVDAPGLEALIKPGDSRPLDEVYCRHILAGRLPELIPDTAREPLAVAMPITQAVPIGAHVSVPIRLADGSTYGMFCCLGPNADPSLNRRDLQMMRAFADLAAFEIDRVRRREVELAERRATVQALVEGDGLSIVHQPIEALTPRGVIGFECLARFAGEPQRTPDVWFAEAEEVGLRTELEIAAVRLALASAAPLPDDVYVSINASPATLLDDRFHAALAAVAGDRLVVEITENATVENYGTLVEALRPLRERGFRFAVDDAGAGYSSMQHILQLRPDFIKLDMSLTRDIDRDPARRALADALIGFAHDVGSRIVAEGVETQEELRTLQRLGADAVQGYLIGRPRPPAVFEADADEAVA
jgi:EAL domain-containing protein (putative c-di-GMP-specific phosphodiesterase class I)